MEHLKKLKNIKFHEWLLYILIFSLFFPVRKVINFGTSELLGQYSDFTSVSLYLSDFIIITLLIVGIIKRNINLKVSKISLFLIFLILISFFANFQVKSTLLWFSLIKNLELVIIFELISQYLSKDTNPRGKILNFALILAIFQVSLEIFQFLFRKSLGLFYLGESSLSTSLYLVAKIVAHGTTYLRGYGTFPHPNLLSVFLIVIILAYISQYYIKSHKSFKLIVLRFFGLFFLIFGLFITFSRAGLLSFAVGIAFIIVFWVFSKVPSKLIKNLTISLFGSIIISLSILWPFYSTRLTITDNAVKERGFYNQIAFKIIKDKPLTGLGFNQTLIHMQQYSPVKLEPWEIQPIHNYYLISLAEMGFGAILLIFIIAFPIIGLFKALILSIKHEKLDPWNLTILAIAGAFLLLFCLDHYFYTIWPTQILLWLMIGLAIETSFTWNNQIIE